MENENKTYNQEQVPPQMPWQGPMPPIMGGPRRKKTWKESLMRNYGGGMQEILAQKDLRIPNWLNSKPIVFFFIAMFACWISFGYVPSLDVAIVASISVVLFFYGGYTMSKNWRYVREKQFLRNVFIVGVVVRLLWAFYGYFFFNMEHYGFVYGNDMDTGWFMRFGKDLSHWLAGESRHTLSEIIDYQSSAIDDVGYPMWLGLIYLIVGEDNDVVVPFIFKSIFGAYCAISIYRIAKRHFEVGTARMAALFCMLNPNMIYWCGSMMKETEMVFLCCLAVDNLDRVLTSGDKYTFRALLPGVIAAFALMFFRSALGIVIFLAFFFHIVMASNKVMSIGKKIIAGVLVGSVVFFGMGSRIQSQSQKMIKQAQSGAQESSLNARATDENGNTFAKYAGATVFAPLIFTIPFPTFNDAVEFQYTQKLLAGGSYIKNILSFFVILVLVLLLVSGEWKKHVFIGAYTLGYLAVLVVSAFAQSGRFHMPVIPVLMLFAAYGIQITKSNKRIKHSFALVLVVEVLICLVWNWFKLKGRGMI